MNYAKPEVMLFGSAASVIEIIPPQSAIRSFELFFFYRLNPVYDLDESRGGRCRTALDRKVV